MFGAEKKKDKWTNVTIEPSGGKTQSDKDDRDKNNNSEKQKEREK